jgi:hypothetical protein
MLFGKMPVGTVDLLRTIAAAVSRIRCGRKRIRRTKAVKAALCELGRKRGFKVYACVHLGPKRLKEWVLDVVWWSPKRTGGVQLAVESEFGNGVEILDDFEKLMCIKSPMKLMVFSSSKGKVTPDEMIAKIEEYLVDFDQHVSGETYVLADFAECGHRYYKYRVPHDGKLKQTEVRFSPRRTCSVTR